MWILSNDTPFAAERSLVADRNGADVWVVAVKGTFLIRPDGTTILADEQEPLVAYPEHTGDPAVSSLKYECDLDYAKPTTDILLRGHACAPRGMPVTEIAVSMNVGPVSKVLRVTGDRTWSAGVFGPKLTEPEPFVKMPITYERAYGGTDCKLADRGKHGWEPRNPIGTGFAVDPDHLIGQPAPNVEEAGQGRSRRPAGFGPIARHWGPRATLAGTYDATWQNSRFPLLPKDFDERFFQCAPEDQQAPQYLKGREPVELRNLTPDGLLTFTLPRVALRFRTMLAGATIEHRAHLHTVMLEPDVPRVLMVWHTSLPCHGKKLKLIGTTVSRKTIIN